MNNIFLIGFMGAGKSTISSKLHELYGMEIIEMDQQIVDENQMSIADIFRIHGEEYFRKLETELLIRCQGQTNKIVSCGGGVAMRDVNVREMKKSGKIVLLTASPETILERVKDDHNRPLLENRKSVEGIRELLEIRRPKYESAADFSIATDSKSAEEICAEILAACQV